MKRPSLLKAIANLMLGAAHFVLVQTNHLLVLDSSNQGILTEGKCLSTPRLIQISCSKYYKYFFLSYKTSYVKREVNCSDTSPSVRVPCSNLLLVQWILLISVYFYRTFCVKTIFTFGVNRAPRHSAYWHSAQWHSALRIYLRYLVQWHSD